MSYYLGLSHCVTALVEISAPRAFAFLCDPIQLGTWSIGCMRVEPVEPSGLSRGTSLYDDSTAYFRIDADPQRLIVDYWVGSADRLVPRISARVIAAEVCELAADQCYVSLTAWRSAQMSDTKWRQLCSAHEAEIWLLKARIEGVAPQ